MLKMFSVDLQIVNILYTCFLESNDVLLFYIFSTRDGNFGGLRYEICLFDASSR